MNKKIALELNSIDLLKHVLYKDYKFPDLSIPLNLTQERILMTVRNTEKLPMVTIARAIGLEKGPFSQTVDKLEDMGLITRVKSASDKRSSTLQLTEEGISVAQCIEDGMEAHFREKMAQLSALQVEEFFHALSTLQKTAQFLNTK